MGTTRGEESKGSLRLLRSEETNITLFSTHNSYCTRRKHARDSGEGLHARGSASASWDSVAVGGSAAVPIVWVFPEPVCP